MNIALRIIRSLLLSVWSLFRFSLNFDPVKEILKIRCHIYISMNKVNILRKIHAKMKSFAPTILHHGKKLNILTLSCRFITSYTPSYNLTSYNLTPPISRVLIGQHLIFCSLTSPTCCNLPRKCTPVKYKNGQKAGFPNAT